MPPYAYRWMVDVPFAGYVVYRNVNDMLDDRHLYDYHRVAIFVSEEEAKHYCDYRNYLVSWIGSDKLTFD